MQYTLMTSMGIYMDNDTPAQSLFFAYSSFRKDEREQEQQRAMLAAKGRNTPRLPGAKFRPGTSHKRRSK